ncbi:MAG: GyrI-like domain-containing protein [Candidatus Marinimicrobia bacterium]|nr:GyrI-like domain-containing protein [Candidatus Neomarinimicrobiota bacterium]
MKNVLLVILTLSVLVSCGKNFKEYEYLLEPQIIDKAPQKLLVYEVVGNPNEVGGEAFGALFSTFFKLKKEHKLDMAVPRARWPKPLETPKDEWLGIYAMPVNDSVMEIPEKIQLKYPKLKLETWKYGMTAEILHIGSYASEPASVEKLHKLMEAEGYEISGPHEEEYLKGPGMFGPGNPDKYYTIIRYPVKKRTPVLESNIIQTEVTEETKIVDGGVE